MKAGIYGVVWLYIYSPWLWFVILGSLTTQPIPQAYEVVYVIFGTWFYLYHIWLPVRRKCYKLDKEFCERTKMY